MFCLLNDEARVALRSCSLEASRSSVEYAHYIVASSILRGFLRSCFTLLYMIVFPMGICFSILFYFFIVTGGGCERVLRRGDSFRA